VHEGVGVLSVRVETATLHRSMIAEYWKLTFSWQGYNLDSLPHRSQHPRCAVPHLSPDPCQPAPIPQPNNHLDTSLRERGCRARARTYLQIPCQGRRLVFRRIRERSAWIRNRKGWRLCQGHGGRMQEMWKGCLQSEFCLRSALKLSLLTLIELHN
jgi:hypothetical protein